VQALLVINASSKHGAECQARVVRALEGAGLRVDIARTDSPEALRDRIRERATDVDRVVVAGGDGTLHAALPALLDTSACLAIVPTGTANDLARSLEIPMDLEAACAIAAGPYTRRIDVSRVNGIPFVNVAHVGLGVRVVRELSGLEKRRWGVLGYARALWRAARLRRPFRTRLLLDGTTLTTRCLHVAVGNARCFGGGTVIDEEAAVDDGRMAVVWLEPRPLGTYLARVLSLRAGRHRNVEFTARRFVQGAHVETRRPMDVTADGEWVTRTPAEFEIVPRCLVVSTPRIDDGPG